MIHSQNDNNCPLVDQYTRTKLVGLLYSQTVQWSPGSDRFCPYLNKTKRKYDVEPKREKEKNRHHSNSLPHLVTYRTKSQHHRDKPYYCSYSRPNTDYTPAARQSTPPLVNNDPAIHHQPCHPSSSSSGKTSSPQAQRPLSSRQPTPPSPLSSLSSSAFCWPHTTSTASSCPSFAAVCGGA